jgi:hypothetical protein
VFRDNAARRAFVAATAAHIKTAAEKPNTSVLN